MKIMICGKGGCGKSTVAALLAKEYARMGRRVLVVDGDESNFGLHRQLGCPLPRDFTEYCGGRRGVMATKKGADVRDELFGGRWDMDDIPADYVSESGGVRLLAIGKIHEAGEGCACAMGVLEKNFLPNLVLRQNDVVLIDAEAGVEHFGRGVDSTVDAILMVVDASYESLMLSEKIRSMGEALGKPVYYVLNKADAEQLSLMRERIPDASRILAALEQNREIQSRGLLGESLEMEIPEIRELALRLEKGVKGTKEYLAETAEGAGGAPA